MSFGAAARVWVALVLGSVAGALLANGAMAGSWCQSLDYQGVANFWSAKSHEFKCYKVSGDIRVEQTFKWGKP